MEEFGLKMMTDWSKVEMGALITFWVYFEDGTDGIC